MISNFKLMHECTLLLVEKEKAYGMKNKIGDFSFNNNIIKRWQHGEKKLYYSGLQMIVLDIFR